MTSQNLDLRLSLSMNVSFAEKSAPIWKPFWDSCSVEELSVEELTVEELSVDEVSFEELSDEELVVRCVMHPMCDVIR